jgi:hypothetical protein
MMYGVTFQLVVEPARIVVPLKFKVEGNTPQPPSVRGIIKVYVRANLGETLSAPYSSPVRKLGEKFRSLTKSMFCLVSEKLTLNALLK